MPRSQDLGFRVWSSGRIGFGVRGARGGITQEVKPNSLHPNPDP